ncbi:hypothetical protein [Rubinisphaera margarita]|uniref:hypothetical protein n=1 Tax=Rubinisphaera margarita TaxID=2909586 RepID=UPI001EE863DF|nr:hypothetical protein [Rubinisphaera margarita]MCG6158229.1 hypothetical protein [Rubinisphaera margarita]
MTFNNCLLSLKRRTSFALACWGGLLLPSLVIAAPPVPLSQYDLGERPDPVVRVFWQDRETASLKWADVTKGEEWSLAPAEIEGFPELDPERQNLVQMDILDGKLLVGIRDDDGGGYESGWVAVSTGVVGHSHGDHYDWQFEHPPEVLTQKLDTNQGNPAHLYTYDGAFYLANDTNDGFTQFFPNDLASRSKKAGRFFSGGGNHITLAAVKNRVAYSTWIDGGGPNAGRVDVVNLRKSGNRKSGYSFTLPSGTIHGATANSGRVFFAPAEGVCWVETDSKAQQSPEGVEIHHLDLGADPETQKPLRTGAFSTHRNYVLFSTGAGESSALCLVDSKADDPEVMKLPIEVADGLSLTTPQPILTAAGKRLAILFQDRKVGDGEELLTIVDLDPNGDRDFSDAEVARTIVVGPTEIDGHYGHHSIAFDSDGAYACLSNSGDGTLWLISLISFEVLAEFNVEGCPGSVLAIGARNRH